MTELDVRMSHLCSGPVVGERSAKDESTGDDTQSPEHNDDHGDLHSYAERFDFEYSHVK